MNKKTESDAEKYRAVLKYTGLGMQWFVLLGLGVWGGMKIDKITGWNFPAFTVILPLLALCISLWQLIREFSKPKVDKKSKQPKL
jgi:hypothetical protein